MVIIHHIEQFKYIFGLENFWQNNSIKILGKLGVALFFVLSGFLITYLLLEEKERTKTINIKAFYLRRIFRIWPLYYLIFAASLFIFPYVELLHIPSVLSTQVSDYMWVKIALFVFLLPNLVLTSFGAIPFAAPTWSIGVEEQFYLIWPKIIKHTKKPLITFLLITVCYYIVNGVLEVFKENVVLKAAFDFWNTFLINLMVIGAIAAHLAKKQSPILKYLFHKYVQMFAYVLIFGLLISGVIFSYFHYEIYGILFGIVILNLAINKKSIVSLEYKILNYLGKISYGLYLYHCITICFVINLLKRYASSVNLQLVSVLSVLLTVLISGLSYKYFETYFIKKKQKLAIVKSNKE